jgi:hypothetical protein
MAWPTFADYVPAPLRGGPLPDDVLERAGRGLREGWMRHVAKRVQGAEERALALVALPTPGASPFGPYALLFDGRTLEIASAEPGLESSRSPGQTLQSLGLPSSGLIASHAGVSLWRESLSDDQAQQRWRSLGGDEAFALPLGQPEAGLEAYALVRRGADRMRVVLTPSLVRSEVGRAWIERFRQFLREDVSSALRG